MPLFLRIVRWDEYQHYKHRDPPWIKLHRRLLSSETWVSADDASRALAIASMMLASGCENRVPFDAKYIRRAACLNSDPDFSFLIKCRFIEIIDENGNVASNMLALCKRFASTKTETETEAETDRPTDAAQAPPVNGFADAKTRLFRDGLFLLKKATGRTEPACRALVGKWLKQCANDATIVAGAIEVGCQQAEPVAYIRQILEKQFPTDDPGQWGKT